MNQRISEGTVAPTFRAEDLFGHTIDLEDYVGRPLLLSFFRNAACAICNLRVHRLIQKYPAYQQKGLAIVAVFESPRENMLQYVGKQDAPFPLIANPAADLYDLYGVEVSDAKMQATMAAPNAKTIVQEAADNGFVLTPEAGSNFQRIPADFLIGADGIVQRAFYAELVGEHLPFEEIEAYLETAGVR